LPFIILSDRLDVKSRRALAGIQRLLKRKPRTKARNEIHHQSKPFRNFPDYPQDFLKTGGNVPVNAK
jgi:hypothetical protein